MNGMIESKLLNICEGNCDSDSHFAEGMVCF